MSLLLADRTPGALKLRAVECDPAIVTLPGASTGPPPPVPSVTELERPVGAPHPLPEPEGRGGTYPHERNSWTRQAAPRRTHRHPLPEDR